MPRRYPARNREKTVSSTVALACVSAATLGGAGACKRFESSASTQIATGFNLDNVPVPPVTLDREFQCPTEHTTLETTVDGRPLAYRRASEEKATAWNALSPVVREIVTSEGFKRAHPRTEDIDLKLAVILVRRQDGVPHYLYLSNGTQDAPYQPWSSSKYIAFAALGARLREESKRQVGLDGDVADPNCVSAPNPAHRRVPIGDLVTAATLYRDLRLKTNDCRSASQAYPLDSNNISTWAKNLSGRSFNQKLVQDWMGRPGERFDGGYGTYSPDNLERGRPFGKKVTAEDSSAAVELKPPPAPSGVSNSLSAFTLAEFLKRLVMFREDAYTRVPSLQWEDVKIILYGAKPGRSRYFADLQVGGMQGGSSSYIEAALGGPQSVDADTRGQWRTFTKIGYGRGKGKPANDFVWHGYGCMPRFNASGRATNAGKEFIISAYLGGNVGRTDKQQDAILTSIVQGLVARIMNGTIDRTTYPASADTPGIPGAPSDTDPSLPPSIDSPSPTPAQSPSSGSSPTVTPSATPRHATSPTPTPKPTVTPTTR